MQSLRSKIRFSNMLFGRNVGCGYVCATERERERETTGKATEHLLKSS